MLQQCEPLCWWEPLRLRASRGLGARVDEVVDRRPRDCCRSAGTIGLFCRSLVLARVKRQPVFFHEWLVVAAAEYKCSLLHSP